MVNNLNVTEPVRNRKEQAKRTWLASLGMGLFLLIATACLLTWPIQENVRLVGDGSRMMYRKIGRIARTNVVRNVAQKVPHMYASLAHLRLPASHSDLVVSTDCIQEQGAIIKQSLLRTTAVSNVQKTLPALYCPPVPILQATMARATAKPKAARLSAAATSTPSVVKTNANPKTETTTVSRARGPVELTSLRDRATCNQGVVLNVVAHEDDDILFMNPDIQTDVTAGRCIRTVYMTAGDSGQADEYWMGREQGAKAAYAAMYGVTDNWRDGQQTLAGRQITVSYLQDVPQISLIFLHLPDGNIAGEGFASTGNQSLQQLLDGQIANLHVIRAESSFSQSGIVDALAGIMQTDAPGYIRTQNPLGEAEGDHADHAATGELTSLAADKYKALHTLAIYAGYPEKALDPNVAPDQFSAKQAVFLAYAVHDNAVCQTAEDCAANPAYGSYLARQYRLSEVTSGQ